MINKMSTPLLLESYEKAKELNLDSDFISILEDELDKREEVAVGY